MSLYQSEVVHFHESKYLLAINNACHESLSLKVRQELKKIHMQKTEFAKNQSSDITTIFFGKSFFWPSAEWTANTRHCQNGKAHDQKTA